MKKIQGNEIESLISVGSVYLQFSATWCGPCKSLKRTVESVSGDHPDVNFYYVDIDECDPQVLKKFDIRSVPKTYFYKDSKEVSHSLGSIPVAKLKEALNSICV
tara:strand:- start:684 stop:995 length:312 start_codon:yes stop_codon:yes gene_type:complete